MSINIQKLKQAIKPNTEIQALQCGVVNAFKNIEQVIGDTLPGLKDSLHTISMEVERTLSPIPRSHTFDVLSGEGPIGRELGKFLRIYDAVLAKPLEPGVGYTWMSDYQSQFNFYPILGYNYDKRQQVHDIVNEITGYFNAYDTDNMSFFEVKSSRPDEVGIVIKPKGENTFSELHYYHPGEDLLVRSCGVFVPGTYERLEEAVSAFFEEEGISRVVDNVKLYNIVTAINYISEHQLQYLDSGATLSIIKSDASVTARFMDKNFSISMFYGIDPENKQPPHTPLAISICKIFMGTQALIHPDPITTNALLDRVLAALLPVVQQHQAQANKGN